MVGSLDYLYDSHAQLVRTLVHHCSPSRLGLLFGYEFNPGVMMSQNLSDDSSCSSLTLSDLESWIPARYQCQSDWQAELKRLAADQQWRVSSINTTFNISES